MSPYLTALHVQRLDAGHGARQPRHRNGVRFLLVTCVLCSLAIGWQQAHEAVPAQVAEVGR